MNPARRGQKDLKNEDRASQAGAFDAFRCFPCIICYHKLAWPADFWSATDRDQANWEQSIPPDDAMPGPYVSSSCAASTHPSTASRRFARTSSSVSP